MAVRKTGKQYIKIRGANENNLKNLDVDIPRDEFVVLTGLSGSGKSSLAFDTIYAEGQRRYMESLSSYARQFLGQMEKPNVESIEGLSPAISIDQKSTNRNPRSTVGTVTEIYDYFRLSVCENRCPALPEVWEGYRKTDGGSDGGSDHGNCRNVPGSSCWHRLCEEERDVMKRYWIRQSEAVMYGCRSMAICTNCLKRSNWIRISNIMIDIVVDRLVVKPGIEKRLTDSVESVLALADGLLVVDTMDGELSEFQPEFFLSGLRDQY